MYGQPSLSVVPSAVNMIVVDCANFNDQLQ